MLSGCYSVKWHFESSNGFLEIAILVGGPCFKSLTKLSLKVRLKTYNLKYNMFKFVKKFFFITTLFVTLIAVDRQQ